MIWAAVLTAAALFLIWKAGLMVWYVRYRPKGKVVYNTAPDIVVPPVTLPPIFSIAPAITGTPTEGQTLTSTTGTASNSPTYTRQWRRNGVNISGATGSTYLLVNCGCWHGYHCDLDCDERRRLGQSYLGSDCHDRCGGVRNARQLASRSSSCLHR